MVIAAREESLENWPPVLKCFYLRVTCIISTNLLLAKACHEGTYDLGKGGELQTLACCSPLPTQEPDLNIKVGLEGSIDYSVSDEFYFAKQAHCILGSKAYFSHFTFMVMFSTG